MAPVIAKCYACPDKNGVFAESTVTRREVTEDDVRIKIKYSGVCHSDLHFARNELNNTTYPCCPGHEIIGEVEEIGSNVTKFKVGENVGVGVYVKACENCEQCKSGEEVYCDKLIYTYNSVLPDGSVTFGGYSTHIVTDYKYVVALPEGIDLSVCAPLLCAGITVYSPMAHLEMKAGDKVAVAGLGGLGHLAVRIAKALGCHVTVISSSDKKKEEALKLHGADDYVNSSNPEEMEAKRCAFNYVVNTISAEHDVDAYTKTLALDGTMIFLGLTLKLTVSTGLLLFKRRKLMGSLVGTMKQTEDMLQLCADKGVSPMVEMLHPSQVNEAHERLLKNDFRYRFVLDFTQEL